MGNTLPPRKGYRSGHPGLFSPKALNLFDTCRHSYELEYLIKRDTTDEPSATLVVAHAVHRALADLYRLPAEKRNEAAAHRLLRGYWKRFDRRGVFTCEDDEIARGELALGWLTDYCHIYDLSITPVAIEQWGRARLPSGRTISGKIDRVDPLSACSLEVVDYKTGWHKLSEDELREDIAAQLYAVGASYEFGAPVERVTYIYLAHCEEVTWQLEDSDLEDLIAGLEARLDTLLAERQFAANPSDHCRWCKFRRECDSADASA